MFIGNDYAGKTHSALKVEYVKRDLRGLNCYADWMTLGFFGEVHNTNIIIQGFQIEIFYIFKA